MENHIKVLAAQVHPEIVALRRHLHANPELSLEEVATAKTLAKELQAIGCEVETGIGGHGIIAHLRGSSPGRCIALRADMDALPIQEENKLPFASSRAGVMHACGHDAHMASLMGAAKILGALQDELAGTFRFLFQPSEEKAPGGAKPMLEAGALEARGRYPAPDAVIGQHVRPDIAAGRVGIRPGAFMASTDEMHIEVVGEGGHAAEPHRLEADAVYVAAQIVTALQSVVSRHCPPGVPSVLTIGRIEAEGATNIIPARACLRGTFRSMDDTWRSDGRKFIRRIVEHTALAHGAVAHCRFVEGYPVLVNDTGLTKWITDEAVDFLGESNVEPIEMWFASEDFAYYANQLPSCFYVLGVGNEKRGITSGLHTSTFDVDEGALQTGAGLMAHLARRFNDLPAADV